MKSKPCPALGALAHQLFVILCIFLVGSPSVARELPLSLEAEHLRAEREALATPQTLIAPFYSTVGGDRATVYLMSTVSEPAVLELTAMALDGRRLPLGRFEAAPTRHLALPLDELLSGQEPAFERGSLEVAYLGDAESLVGWLVVERGSQLTEFPLQAASALSGSGYLTFWDRARPSSARPAVWVWNRGPSAVEVKAEVLSSLRPEVRPVAVREWALPSGAGRVVELSAEETRRGGIFRLTSTSEPGQLVGTAFLSGAETLGRLPWLAGERLPAPATHRTHHTPPILDGTEDLGNGHFFLTLLNSGPVPAAGVVEIVGGESGHTLGRRAFRLPAGEAAGIDLTGLLRSAPAGSLRLRIEAEEPVHVAGIMQVGKAAREVPFFHGGEGHRGGSYPLPASGEYEVVTRLVNLGAEEVRIVAQLYWDEEDGRVGTYALGPLTVAAGASEEVRLDDLLAGAYPPDVLGRTPSPGMKNGFLRWKAQDGDAVLIGRTEARARSGEGDRFGFNCFGCCFELPAGLIVPQDVSFVAGSSAGFDACIQYDTCSGTMGPYSTDPSSMSVPAPFSWNARVVSSATEGSGDFIFQGEETRTNINCSTSNMMVAGSGKANACKAHLRKAGSATSFWSASQACTQQVGGVPNNSKCSKCMECCNAQRAYNGCKDKSGFVADQEQRACLLSCQTDFYCN